ncbi:petidase, M16 family, putative [Plasmodium ovale wallikeri]|uniref:Petidase, M16 family, putative n=2 Tax=Plasmodium ovale TaxID=36330 RepID=A0A1A8YUB8_PLAOA|nr:petidase, M16 family, putative [Plasmodium ovale wallikeri]SBT35710.1 petidase, M16 family, putative [Plasmodium ovale wallikeri]SBT77098.1 petidase, M16 family, putative [Plasmodium ovale]
MKAIKVYFVTKILLLLVLVYEKYSTCQKTLNNSKSNYGLSDDELRAMLFGLNYNSADKNKDNLVEKTNLENDSLFFRNFTKEETKEKTLSDKAQAQNENVNSNKMEESVTLEKNAITKNAASIKNEKKDTMVETKANHLVQNAPYTDKLNEPHNPHNHIIDTNKYNGTLNDPRDIDVKTVSISKDNISKNVLRNSENDMFAVNGNAFHNNDNTMNDTNSTKSSVLNGNKENYPLVNDSLSAYSHDNRNSKDVNGADIANSGNLTYDNGKQNLISNEPKRVNNYLQKIEDTNLEKPKSLQRDVNIKNHNDELHNLKKEQNEGENTEQSKIAKGNIEAVEPNKPANLMNNGIDKKPERLFQMDETKNSKISDNQNAKEVVDYEEQKESSKKVPYLYNSNNLKNEPNIQTRHNDKVENSLNSGGNNTENVNTWKSTEYKYPNVSYPAGNSSEKLVNFKKDMIKDIKPVGIDKNTFTKLNDISAEDAKEVLRKENKSKEDAFSEKITLKKGTNDKNEYKYFKLKSNGLKILGIINKYSPKGGFSISVDCGGYDDFNEIPGISNLLQRSIFYKSEKRNTTLLSELGKNSSEHNSHTSESFTNYYATGHSEDIYYLLNLFAENLFYPIFDEESIENEANEINNKFISMENNPESCLKMTSQYITDFKYSKFFVYGNYFTLCDNILKNRLNIKKVLYEFHKKCYQPKNMSLTILLGKKANPSDYYNMSDIENVVTNIFGEIKNYDDVNYTEVSEKQGRNMKMEKQRMNRPMDYHYNNGDFAYNNAQNDFNKDNGNEKADFVQLMNEFNYALDLNQKSKYIEILKKEGWEDQVYLYWSSKISEDLYKKIEEFGTMIFLREIFSDFRKNGLFYKISVENKYARDLKIISTCNKYYFNYGILIKLTERGKSYLTHLIRIFQVFINEVSKLFDHDSLDKGINKYILDYYREKALTTDLKFNSDNVYISLNDLINYSNKLLLYSGDPSALITVNNLIEDKNKNDFRNHIKITSLVGSLIRNENLHIINTVDAFRVTNQSKIPNSAIAYAVAENPYIIGEGEITNDINLTLPEVKVCPFSDFSNNIVLNEKSFFCVPYNNRENFGYSENKQMFVSEENENIVKSRILYNMPCLIKSSYGYNVYFKRGLTDISEVKADFIFYFPSENFTFYEAIFTRIHILILRKKIKFFLSDYSNCSVNADIKQHAESYTLHMDANSSYFEEFMDKLQQLLSLKEIPSSDEFNDAYDELNSYVKGATKFGIGNSLKIMYSLFNKYVPTNKEIDDILNSYFFYPSYNAYTKYVANFFHKNYINVFIYGNVTIPSGKGGEQAPIYGIANDGNVDKNGSSENKNGRESSDTLHSKEQVNDVNTEGKKLQEQYQSDSLEISHNGAGIEYIVNLCESFIRNVTTNVIKRSESTYYTRKLINNEDVEINIQNTDTNVNSSSITVSYIIESETILSDMLINIIADLISSDFIKFAKIRYNDGYIVDVKTFFTPYGLGGLLFVIQSFDNDVEKVEADICAFVKYLTFQLMNMDVSNLVKRLEGMKEFYIINNTIFTFNQEYSSILDQLYTGNECFDKKYKIIKIFDELINCPKIILNKINYILKNAKKAIFKEYSKTVNTDLNKTDTTDDIIRHNKRCSYSQNNDGKMSNIQLNGNSNLIKKGRIHENGSRSNIFRINGLHKRKNFITTVSNFVEIKRKGFFHYVMDYFKNNNKLNLEDSSYFDFKSCDDEMSKDNFHIFYDFSNDVNKIREYFLVKFSNDKEIKEKCSIDYEEIRQYCYEHSEDDSYRGHAR